MLHVTGIHKTIIQTRVQTWSQWTGSDASTTWQSGLSLLYNYIHVILKLSKKKKKEEYKLYNILETNNYGLYYIGIIFTDKTNEKYNDDDDDDNNDNVEGHHAKGQ